MTSASAPGPARGRRRTTVRALRIVLAAVIVCLIIWLLAAHALFRDPPLNPVGEADAVVVLAGAADERLSVGVGLVDSGAADELVLSSTGLPGNTATDERCARYEPGVTCFRPDPLTTRGEARAIAALARDRGWDSIIIVTSSYHAMRALTNVSQCSGAGITMAVSEPDLDAVGWLARYVEESTALAAALLRPACANAV